MSKQKFISRIFFLSCYQFLFSMLQAQDSSIIELRGQVTDSLQQPVARATVRLLKGDSLLYTTAADEKGHFYFITQKEKATVISISSASFLSFYKKLDWAGTHDKKFDLGVIVLQQSGKELEKVTVMAVKPLIKREVDKIIYNTTADPESKFKSTFDIMKKVPFLSVDAQGNLLLKGNASYRILINGKTSGMMDNNAMEVLKNLPASTIQNIEVYTTPPSKYEAEGLGGIINIVTYKKVGEGYKGTVNINESFPAGGPGAGFSLTVAQKKLGIEMYGGGNITHNPSIKNSRTRQTIEDNPTLLNNAGESKNNSNGRYIGSQLSYEIDSLQLITLQFNANGYYPKGNSVLISVLQQEQSLLQQFTQLNTSRGRNNGFDGSLNYQLGFKKDKSKLLTTSYRYMQYRAKGETDIDLFDIVNYPQEDFNQFNNTTTLEQTGQVDYVQNIKKVKLEAGLKTIFRQNKSNFYTMQFNPEEGEFEEDANQQNVFANQQNILAAYNTYMFSFKKWDFKAGVRLEQTLNKIDFQSTQTKVDNNYFNLVPSVVINKNNNNGSYFNFGYNQRLKRPGINRLNPFVNRSNPGFEESGNPNLKPSLMHNFDLGYGINKKHAVNIGLSYAMANNLDLKESRYDSITKITYATYSNSGDIAALMLNYNFNLLVTKALRIIINGNLANFWIKSFADGRAAEKQQFLYMSSASGSYTFKKDWIANSSISVYGKNLAPAQVQGTVNGYVASSFSISKSIFNKKLALSAYINNPFTKYRISSTEISWFNFSERSTTQEYFRKFGLSANYQFGKLKKEVKKNKRGINNNDVSN